MIDHSSVLPRSEAEHLTVTSATIATQVPLPGKPEMDTHLLATLKQLIAAADHRAFMHQLEVQNWSDHHPDTLLAASTLALGLNLVTPALRLVQQGVEWFPNHPGIQAAARVLAPPRIIEIGQRAPTQGVAASADWIDAHASDYRGQWVAVNQGQFLAAAPTLQALREQIARLPIADPESTMYSRIF